MPLRAGTLILVAIFLFTGLFSVIASIAGWEWFFNSANSRMLTGRLSRKTARAVYFVIGIAILAMAISMLVSLLC